MVNLVAVVYVLVPILLDLTWQLIIKCLRETFAQLLGQIAQPDLYRVIKSNSSNSLLQKKESGKGPSLGCTVQEEDGHSKRENGRVFQYFLPPTLPGHLCPATEAKGIKRL